MSKNFRNIVIGMLIIFIDINSGVGDILPDFIGYFLVSISGASLFKQTGEKAFSWVSRLGGALAFITLIQLFFPMDSLQTSGDYKPESFLLYTVVTLVLLHMNNFLLSGMMVVKDNFYQLGTDNSKLGEEMKSLKRSRNIYVVLMFIMAATYALGGVIDFKSMMPSLIVVGFFPVFIVMLQVYRTYKNCQVIERKEGMM